jgi:hypothetical protein
MQIQSNCMRYSIALRKFPKRTQKTFGVIAIEVINTLLNVYKAKGPKRLSACGIRELHAAPIMLAINR